VERCCVHNISPFISSSRLSPGSREAEVQRAKVCLNCTEPSVARSSYWTLPVGRYLSDSCCKGSVVILANIELRAIWLKSCRCLLVARWENGKQPVPLTSAFDTWRVPCMTPPQWPTTSTSTLANIAHASMVWHGASGHHFSMAWLLQFGFCGQLWLSPGPYCPSASIQSAKETVVYSKLLQNKQGQCGACRKLWSLDESDLYVCVVPLSALLVIPFVRSDFASDVFSISSPTLRMFDHALNRPLSNRD